MIHYHGVTLGTNDECARIMARRHACVSFAKPAQLPIVAEVCQSFILDNGAFSAWRTGKTFDIESYRDWIAEWHQHPSLDFYFVPDVIDGNTDANQLMRAHWLEVAKGLTRLAVPVWHYNESLEELEYLSRAYGRIALGSAGEYSIVGTEKWWQRTHEAMEVLCDEAGRPRCKLHGLRMLNPTIFSHVPLASADSTNVAQTMYRADDFTGSYQPVTNDTRAAILMERVECHVAAVRWSRPAYGTQQNMELIG